MIVSRKGFSSSSEEGVRAPLFKPRLVAQKLGHGENSSVPLPQFYKMNGCAAGLLGLFCTIGRKGTDEFAFYYLLAVDTQIFISQQSDLATATASGYLTGDKTNFCPQSTRDRPAPKNNGEDTPLAHLGASTLLKVQPFGHQLPSRPSSLVPAS